ncbi:TPA: hypothetical protein KRH44_001133 [Clostridioides difficile]|nr:hypothetical protein [Clostridioides difficile]
MVKYNAHKALAEKKLLEDKIDRCISNFKIVGTKKGSDKNVYETKTSVEDFNVEVSSKYQQIEDLIYNYNALDKAINISNAITNVQIGNKNYTVLEAIKRKNSIELDKSLLRQMVSNYDCMMSEVNRRNEEVQKNTDRMFEEKEKSKDGAELISFYKKQQEWSLVDPLKVREKIEKLRDEIEEFEKEVDFALSTSNALTIIDVDLK